MTSFKDATGRVNTLAINVTAIKRVKALTGVHLPSLCNGKMEGLGALMDDDVGFVDIVYAICKPDLDAAGISDEDFGRAMFGDAILLASRAFTAELFDFFRDARVRAALKKVLEKIEAVHERVQAHKLSQVEDLDPQIVADELIRSSGNAPESSASTPDPSRSAS
jgi:hypothetical protein